MNIINTHNLHQVHVALSPEAASKQGELLQLASLIGQVTDTREQQAAVKFCRELQGVLKDTELTRKAVKSPVLNIGRSVDELADAFSAPLKVQMDRIGKLVALFQEQEKQRCLREEAEIRGQAELLVEETRRKQEEAQTAAAQFNTTNAGEHELNKAIIAEQALQAAEAEKRRVMVMPVPEAQKERGASVRRVPVVEVVDIEAVFHHDKRLVRMELNKGLLNEILVEGIVIPGLKVAWESKTIFRS